MTYRQLGQKEEFIFLTNAHQRKTKTLDFLLFIYFFTTFNYLHTWITRIIQEW